MIIVATFLLRKGLNAVVLFPFIILRNKELKENHELIYHERIHFRQQIELLLVFFYVWYLVEYLINYIRFGDGMVAYYKIRFEKEAYAEQGNFNYLKQRKFWAFLRY